jgi:hypothetical protein
VRKKQPGVRHFSRFSRSGFWRDCGAGLSSPHKGIEKLRYKHQNPVKRGLLASPELWRWSSLRAYFLREAGPVRVNDRGVLTMKIRPPAA